MLATAFFSVGCAPGTHINENSGRPFGDYSFDCLPEAANPPVFISGRSPTYPPKRLVEGEEGFARVLFEVDASGEVVSISLVERSHPAFYGHLKQAMRSWKFQPATLDNEPTDVKCTYRVNFEIYGGGGTPVL